MGKTWLCHVFTTAMLNPERRYEYSFVPVEEDYAVFILSSGFEQAIGHESLARVLSQRTGLNVQFKRATVHLNDDDTIVVAQLAHAQRLGEGQILSAEELAKVPIYWWKGATIVSRFSGIAAGKKDEEKLYPA